MVPNLRPGEQVVFQEFAVRDVEGLREDLRLGVFEDDAQVFQGRGQGEELAE